MNRLDFNALERASRSVMAYDLDDRPTPAFKLATAALPAAGILVVCAFMLSAIL